MVKNRLVTLLTVFLMSAHCMGMQMAAQQSEHNVRTLDETAANELIQQLLRQKYADMVTQLSKISDEDKERITNALNKNRSLSPCQVRFQQTLSGLIGPAHIVAFSPDGRFVFAASWDHSALWNLTTIPATKQKLTGHTKDVESVAFSANGHFLLTGSEDTTARLWDLTKTPITSVELEGHTHCISSVTFSPDSRFALTGSKDNTARLWDLTKSPVTSTELKGHTHCISSVAFSADSHFALTGSKDNTARLWDLTKSPITNQHLTGHTGEIRSVAFSHDSRFALTGSSDCTIRLWDLETSPITSQHLTSHSGYSPSNTFSPNGRFALAACEDYTIHLWDLDASPITRHELKGHTDWSWWAAFSLDNRYVLTGSRDRTARLWDLTKTPISSEELIGHTWILSSVAIGPHGRFAVTTAANDDPRLWQIASADYTSLALKDLLLIIQLIENENLLKDDSDALERLQLIAKAQQQQSVIAKLIADHLYRIKLPEPECWICSERYDPESRICMKLGCCQKNICKVCLDKLGNMSYATEFDGYQFEHSVKKKCPFCNKPASQMGTIKKFKIGDANNHHCSSCDKEKCTFKCSICKTDYYCSKECQAKHWPTHKATCKKK